MKPSKRETVLDTAERLFYKEGFHATGIDRVVAAAGVARMTLYNHFPSKEALVDAVLQRRYGRYLDDLRAAVAARGDRPAVAALTACHIKWLQTLSRDGCIVLKAISEFEHHAPAIAERGRELKRELLALIGETLALDGYRHDEAVAERVLLVLEGTNALAPLLGPGRASAHVDGMISAALAGAAKGSS